MKFYLCQTPDGPQLSGTKEDAKALDPKFDTVEWATDKDALMQRFNDLMRRAHRPAEAPAIVTPVENDEDAEMEPLEAPVTRRKAKEVPSGLDWQSAPEPGSCKRCIAMSEGARAVETIMAITNIEHVIQTTSDKAVLRRIDDALEARAGEATRS